VTEKGNVLFLILIAVALFAALSYAVTSSNRGTADVSREQANIVVGQLLQSTSNVTLAFKRLINSRNCDLTEIDLDWDTSNAFLRNPNSPSSTGDFSCAMFHPNGGGLLANNLPKKAFTDAHPTVWRNTQWIRIENIGTQTGNELVMIARDVKEEVCSAYNEKQNGNPAIPQKTGNLDAGFGNYQGEIRTGGDIVDGTASGQLTYCLNWAWDGDPTPSHTVYVVLQET